MRHIGGSGKWQTVDGSWLTLRLPDAVMAATHHRGDNRSPLPPDTGDHACARWHCDPSVA
ncbi:hypothetical protein ACVXG7_29515 [Enterobacter hormaechei]